MKIKRTSYFKNPEEGTQQMKNWVAQLEKLNGYSYEKKVISTSLGATQLYGFNLDKKDFETLLIFPGFRTTSLIWDFDQIIHRYAQRYRIIFVETNGQPNLSDGHTPDIKSKDYGKWGNEVFEALKIDQAYIAGASFGGLVCMKIALVIPHKIKGAFLLNPGCFRMVSFKTKNMFYNLLPLINTSRKNINKFLKTIVFHMPEHQISNDSNELLIDYQMMAMKQYKDHTQKPYYMSNELDEIQVETHLFVGDQDILIPMDKSIQNAKKHLGKYLKTIKKYHNVAHGIECFQPCIQDMFAIIAHKKSPNK